VLPAGPEKLPDCTADTRSGGSWSPSHHTACSGGTDSRRHESRTSYVARVAARELQAGR